MSTSTTGTPGQGSTTTTPMAPGSQPSSQQSAETSLMAAMIYPHVANGPSEQNSAAQAVQIALMLQDEAVKQEKEKAKADAAKAQAASQAQADAAGGLAALAADPVVVQGMGPGATPQEMKSALDRIKAAAEAAAKQTSGSQSGAGSAGASGQPSSTPVPTTAQPASGSGSSSSHK